MFTARRDPDASATETAAAAQNTVLQIGDVARQVGLSLRTVRFYEEAGLLTPVGRTQGGFRLYDEDALDRLRLIKRMKPLGFTLEEMRSLLAVRDELRLPDATADHQHELRERLKTWAVLAEEKLADLRARAGIAADFVAGLHDDVSRRPDAPDDPGDAATPADYLAARTTPDSGGRSMTCDDGSDGDVPRAVTARAVTARAVTARAVTARAVTAHRPNSPEHDAPSTETSPDRT